MGTERIDPETLAAFLDGRLEGAERERMLRQIAEHPEEYEQFADAAHVAAALAGSDRSAISVANARPTWRWKVALPALIAAGLAVVVLLPKLGGDAVLSPGELAGLLKVVQTPGPGSLAMTLGEQWDQPGWSVTRGEAPDVVEPARAFRLGTRATDVEIAIGAEDSKALPLVATELIQLVSALDGGAPAARMYQGIVDRGVSVDARDRQDASEGLRALMGNSPWFDLGVWAEAARVSVAAGQEDFLRKNAAALRGLMDRIRAEPSPEAGQVLSALQSLQDEAAAPVPRRAEAARLLTQIMVLAGR